MLSFKGLNIKFPFFRNKAHFKVSKRSFHYSVTDLIQYFQWSVYGFTAAKCGECKTNVNIPGGGPGWFCTCGSYNSLPWSGFQIPYEIPKLGPTRAKIVLAGKIHLLVEVTKFWWDATYDSPWKICFDHA